MLHFQKQSSFTILHDFRCGVPKMDMFIRDGLEYILQDSKYSLFIVKDDNLQDLNGEFRIVAMFVISSGMIIRDKDAYMEIEDEGSPFAVYDNGEIIDMTSFQTIEIDYIAVQEEFRNKGIGTEIINQLAALAKKNSKYFLTVDAYHEGEYSAIPFYEKNLFIQVEDYDENKDTCRMFKDVRSGEEK